MAFNKDGSLLAHGGFNGYVFHWNSAIYELKGKIWLIGGDIEVKLFDFFSDQIIPFIFLNTNHGRLSMSSWHSTSHVILGGLGDCRAHMRYCKRDF